MGNMVRIQSYFPKQLLEELRLLAEENETSLAEVIRMATRDFAEKLSKAKASKNGASVLLKSASKIAFTGPKDLSSKADKYLYE